MTITYVEMTPLSTLLKMKHPGNPKLHNIDELIESFSRFGFTMPPAKDETSGMMIAGHGRCEALARMRDEGLSPPRGIEVIPEELGGPEWMVPLLRGLTFANPAERDAYILADNQLTISGGWNNDALVSMLTGIRDQMPIKSDAWTGLGFDEEELEQLITPTQRRLAEGDSDERKVEVTGHERTIGGHKVRPPVQMTNDDWTLHLGDCLEGLRKLPDNSVGTVVTDPPSGIAFMGQEWDKDKGGRDKWIEWLRSVMAECLRVLKPGGHALVWALPRTSHWTAMALELAGFQIRDRVSWLYISGFPKSIDLSKAADAKLGEDRPVVGEAADRRGDGTVYGVGHSGNLTSSEPITAAAAALQGWGSALKPAVEDFWLVRKPLEGTLINNVMKWGVGGLNIDATRIGDDGGTERGDTSNNRMTAAGEDGGNGPEWWTTGHATIAIGKGRWPTNLVVSEAVEIEGIELPATYFYAPKPSTAERDAGLADFEPKSGGELTFRKDGSRGLNSPRAGAGRGGNRRNTHTTVKPLSLMRYLIRLVTPPGEIVLDAFTGSGTTGLAALVEGCRFVGYELSAEYHAIASARLRSIIDDPRQAEEIEAKEADEFEPDGPVTVREAYGVGAGGGPA